MLVTVAHYSLAYEAHLGKTRLESEGIPAFIADEHTVNMQWLYSNALGGVKLQVPPSFADRALAVLNEDRAIPLDVNEEPLCEYCGSTHVERYHFGKRFAFLVFLGIDFPLFPHTLGLKCRACGHKFKT